MKLTLAIPFYNQLHATKGIMGLLKHVTSPSVEWLIIDNGSSDPVEGFFRQVLKPKRLNFIRNDHNIGMVKTYQQIFQNVETDLVAILHNDVYVYEKNWDKRVVKLFKDIPRLGSAGFFGAQGCGPIGQRFQDREVPAAFSGLSNMIEAEGHGIRLQDPYRPAAILDGFAMIFSMEFINHAGGLDQRYIYHHMYDRDLPLTSLSLGYKNIIIPIPCHHVSSLTANQPYYKDWVNSQVKKDDGDQWTHDENTRIFKKKWSHALPLYIENDFSFRKGTIGKTTFKGADIIKHLAKVISP